MAPDDRPEEGIALPPVPPRGVPPVPGAPTAAFPPSPAGGPPPERPGTSRRLALIAGITAAVIVVVGIVGVVVFRDRWSKPSASVAASGTPTVTPKASPSSASPSSSPSPTTARLDPDKAPRVLNPVTVAQDPTELPLPCAEQDSSLTAPKGLSTWGAWVAVRSGHQVILVDRVDHDVAWCTRVAFGSVSGRAKVPSESPVGRPDYVPALDADTMAATSPDGSPLVMGVDGRLWVVQPVFISRPDLGSQQKRGYAALIGFDDTGTARWITAYADEPNADDTEVYRDGVTGRLAAINLRPNATSGESGPTVRSIDPSTGTIGPVWNLPKLRESKVRLHSGTLVAPVSMDRQEQLRIFDIRNGSVIGDATPAGSGWDWGFVGSTLYSKAESGGPGWLLSLVDLGTASATEVNLPFAFNLSDCVSNGQDTIVCKGRDGNTPKIAAVDVAGQNVKWAWSEGDPDPVTKVARSVPALEGMAGQSVLVRRNYTPYIIDGQTGADRTLDTSFTDEISRFDSVSTTGSGLAFRIVS